MNIIDKIFQSSLYTAIIITLVAMNVIGFLVTGDINNLLAAIICGGGNYWVIKRTLSGTWEKE